MLSPRSGPVASLPRIAYLIFLHTQPAQAGRFLKRLYYPGCRLYLHVDARQPLGPFREALGGLPADAVFFLPSRRTIRWGYLDLSEAYLDAFRFILNDWPTADFVFVQSGQDYPLTTPAALLDWLGRHADTNFVRYGPIDAQSSDFLKSRIERYHLIINRHRAITHPPVEGADFKRRAFSAALNLLPGFQLPRRHPAGFSPYFGSNWLKLKPAAARYVLDTVRAHPELLRFYRYGYVPDEHLFQTILLNGPDWLRGSIWNDDLTYSFFDRPPEEYPRPLETRHFSALVSSSRFFARKFDERHDAHILDLLDAHLAG
jgi:hypothetical protein